MSHPSSTTSIAGHVRNKANTYLKPEDDCSPKMKSPIVKRRQINWINDNRDDEDKSVSDKHISPAKTLHTLETPVANGNNNLIISVEPEFQNG